MRSFLDVLYWQMLVFASPYWFYKAPQARRYRAGIPQRLGLVPRRENDAKCLWVHCASVGEASIPRELVELFLGRHPDWDVVFSTITDTGAERLRKLYPDRGVFYWPLDLSPCVDVALSRVRPDAVLLVEQELWPNFLLGCRRRGVPVAVVNGRMRARTVPFVRGVGRLFRPMWDALQLCCARSEADGRRYREAGLAAGRVVVTGSLKYEALPAETDRDQIRRLRELFGFSGRERVLVAGSTHPGEEVVLCRVWRRLRQEYPDLRLVLVPRHIERAEALGRQLRGAGFRVASKTELQSAGRSAPADSVILVDTIGDLVGCYGLAACAFVGRSLFPPGGGQNMMEPAALGRAVMVGAYTGNFEPEMEVLSDAGAVVQVEGEGELEGALQRLLSCPGYRGELGRRARAAIRQNHGAAGATLKAIERALVH